MSRAKHYFAGTLYLCFYAGYWGLFRGLLVMVEDVGVSPLRAIGLFALACFAYGCASCWFMEWVERKLKGRDTPCG